MAVEDVVSTVKQSRTPHIAVLIDGDLSDHTEGATKHSEFIEALRRQTEVYGVGDMMLHGLPRLLCAAVAWRPNPREWKGHYRANPLTFTMRSRQSRKWLERQAHRPDIVVQVGALSRPTLSPPSIPYALYLDFTFALTSREWPARSPMTPSEQKIWRRLEGKTYADAAVIFVRSAYAGRSLCEDYDVPLEKIRVVGAGVNVALPERADLPDRMSPHVLYIGNDFRRKGGDVLLRAWPQVRRHVPNARLTIFGQTTSAPPDGVDVYQGIWDRSAVVRALKQTSLFVMPSRCETWGDVFLEAMAYELPCIGTTADAMPEIIEDGATGYVVPPGDDAALAEGIVTLLQHPDLARQFGASGRQRVEERFLWDQVVARMLDVLRQTVDLPLGSGTSWR